MIIVLEIAVSIGNGNFLLCDHKVFGSDPPESSHFCSKIADLWN